MTGEEILDQGKLSVIDETHTPNYIGHALPEHMRVPEGYKELVARYRAALPSIRWSMEDMITKGDKVVKGAARLCRKIRPVR